MIASLLKMMGSRRQPRAGRQVLAALSLVGILPLGCGPDRRRCSGPHPDFVVVLELTSRPLPVDTVVHVTYGGSGMEEYDLADPSHDPEVVFCSPASADGGVVADSNGSAGASGDAANGVEALRCELWTGGFASLRARGTGLADAHYDLSPNDDQCTIKKTIVLDSPDAG